MALQSHHEMIQTICPKGFRVANLYNTGVCKSRYKKSIFIILKNWDRLRVGGAKPINGPNNIYANISRMKNLHVRSGACGSSHFKSAMSTLKLIFDVPNFDSYKIHVTI